MVLLILLLLLAVFVGGFLLWRRKIFPSTSNPLLGGLFSGRLSTPPCDYSQLEAYAIPPETLRRHSNSFLKTVTEQQKESLKNLQLVLLIDHSGSMKIRDTDLITGGHCTRWNNLTRGVLYLFETMLRYDADGNVPVFFFSSGVREFAVNKRERLFQELQRIVPSGGTNLLGALKLAFRKHASPGTLFIVFTDGQPDPGQLREVILLIKQTFPPLDREGNLLNILFIRVGDDPDAIAFLQDMDDCQEIGDWVDTKSDNELFSLGPEVIIANAIWEHIEGSKDTSSRSRSLMRASSYQKSAKTPK